MSSSVMSGSFFVDSPVPPKLDLAGAQSQLFQVPQTASASSSLYRSISFSRKRNRYGVGNRQVSDSHADLASPAPLVNTDYHLAGGGIDHSWRDFHENSAELDYRPNRFQDPHTLPPIDASIESLSTSEISENQGRKRSRREPLPETTTTTDEKSLSQPEKASWGRTVFSVVGKVWDFCWSGAFRGFYAGGGQGYSMAAGPSAQIDQKIWTPSEKERPSTGVRRQRNSFTPVPGQYPDDDGAANDIQQNWVMVSNNKQDLDMDDASPSTQAKRAARRNIVPSHTQRRTAVMPRLGKRTANRPSTPMKSQSLSPSMTRESPSSAETQRHVAKMRRMEREEDASIQRLNRQLQAMIKQGKEALGTRVEVDDLDMED